MPGALLLDGEGRLVGVWELEIGGGEIQGINSVVNPDKLAHLGPLADMRALLAPASPPVGPRRLTAGYSPPRFSDTTRR